MCAQLIYMIVLHNWQARESQAQCKFRIEVISGVVGENLRARGKFVENSVGFGSN